MKVSCPKCETVYQLTESKIPGEGTYARCPKCEARFFLDKKFQEEAQMKKDQTQACSINKKPFEINRKEKKNPVRQKVQEKACRNCDRTIGKLEVPYIHNGHAICYECYKRLNAFSKGIKDVSAKSAPRKAAEHQTRSLDKTSEKSFPAPASSGMIHFFLDSFAQDLAIDLGTANTLVYVKRKGIILNEPSVVAVRTNSRMENRVLAVGLDAKRMLGKVPGNIAAIRPMRDGVIADFEVAGTMLKHFIRKVRSRLAFFSPKIIIAVPSGVTQVEKRAVKVAAEQAGARQVFLIEEPMAAAIGADLRITEPTCNMIVDIGGGTTEVAVISLYGIVSSRSLRVAGDKMDAAIIRYIKNKYNFIIGERTAEALKIGIGNAYPDPRNLDTMEVKGWDMVTGKPKILTLDSEEIQEAILEQMCDIVETIKAVLDRTPQELTADVVEKGIVLTGGVALLKNLDKFLSEETGLPFTMAKNPLSTVALGSGKTLENPKVLRQVII
ncbi:MAG: hypothetical protein B6245_11295 [Desulfobacteraceae bacterium 4572_88]|nr:MAG: hypothetical protein B6245_11295 [Desulfobacteraceae bacterium 4572_88]RLC07797.1 MAG: hypothetical protein DRI57_25250 [Deltaproteobacteria bacterium]